ncbi:MAG: tetratricopeptide repeat protein [Candidatus Sericytochromatia bacterium]
MHQNANDTFSENKDTSLEHEKLLNMLGANVTENDSYSEVFSLLNQMYKTEDETLPVVKVVKTEEVNEIPKEAPKAQEIKKDFEYYSNQGNDFLRRREYSSALNSYKSAFKQNSKDLNLIMKIAFCYQKTNKTNNAIELYKKIEKAFKDDVTFHKNLADAYLNVSNYSLALNSLFKVIEIEPNNSEYYFKLIESCYDLEDYNGAIHYSTEYFSKFDDDVRVLNIMGDSYNKMGFSQNAVTCYQKTIAIDQFNYKALLSLGETYYEINDYMKSAEFLYKAQKIKPDWFDVASILKLAKSFENLKVHDKAIEFFTIYLETNQDDADTLYSLAMINKEQNNYDKASLYLKQMAKMDLENSDVWKELAECYIELEKYEKAMDCLRRSLKINPKQPKAIFNMGLCYQNTNQFEKAIDFYTKYYKFSPKDSEVLHRLGSCYHEILNTDEAISFYSKAVSLEPQKFKSWHNLGLVYYNTNNYKKSVDALKQALLINTKDPATWFTLASSYYKLEDYINARKNYKKMLIF